MATRRPQATAVVSLADRHRLRALARVLHDETLDARLRIAGTLVVLYAQPVARMVRLTTDEITFVADAAHIRLARDPPPLPSVLKRRSRASPSAHQTPHSRGGCFPDRGPASRCIPRTSLVA